MSLYGRGLNEQVTRQRMSEGLWKARRANLDKVLSAEKSAHDQVLREAVAKVARGDFVEYYRNGPRKGTVSEVTKLGQVKIKGQSPFFSVSATSVKVLRKGDS